MIRQAHTYLAGAVSGTAVVAGAVVAFVLLVSLQALRDWPLAGIGLGGAESAVVRPAQDRAPAGPEPGRAAHREAGAATGAQAAAAGDRLGSGPAVSGEGSGPPGAPGGNAPEQAADQAAGSAPTAGAASDSRAKGSGEGGGGPTGSSGQEGGGGKTTSEAIAGTVNETVKGVDEATGGAIGATGVTKVTEEAVNGVAGPESAIGKTVDETAEAVNGLLGANR